MTDLMRKPPITSPPDLLGKEIGIALIIKVILLICLWFLIYHWSTPSIKPDIAQQFALPNIHVTADTSAHTTKETLHVR